MIRCQRCGAYMVWSYEKGWHCPNGCEVGIYTTDYATEATRGADYMGDISSLAKASQMIIAELEAKLSKAEHDRDRYRERIATEKHRADVAEEALGKVQATALSILHANSYDVDVLLKRAIKAGVKVDDLLCSPKCNRAKQYEEDLQRAEARLAELKEAGNAKN